MAFMNANPLRLNGPVELTVLLVSHIHDSSTSIDLQVVRVVAPRMPGPHFNAPMKCCSQLLHAPTLAMAGTA